MSLAVPYDHELERQLLAAAYVHAEDRSTILESLQPSDFYVPVHGAFFEQLRAFAARPEVFDEAMFISSLRSHAQFSQFEEIYSGFGIGYFADIDLPILRLKELRAARTVVEASRRLAADGCTADATRDPELYLDRAERDLSEALKGRSTRESSESALEVMGKVFARLTQPKADGRVRLTSGLKTIDRLIGGFEPTKYIVVAARPGKGKSAAAMKFAVENGRKGYPIGWWSGEMETEELGDRELSYESHVDGYKLREAGWKTTQLYPDEWQRLQLAGDRLSDLPIRHDYVPGISWEDLARKIRREHQKYGIKGAIIDYLQLLHSTKSFGSRRDELSYISKGIVGLAGQLRIPMIVMAQLNRDSVKGGSERRPVISDIADCGAIEQDANIIILIHSQDAKPGEQQQPPEWIIDKNRGGPTGIVPVHFRREFTRFDDLAHEGMAA